MRLLVTMTSHRSVRRALRFSAALAAWAVVTVGPVCAQAKRVFIAPDDHTDYMWTANEAAYRAAFLEMLDYYVALADSSANEAPPYRSRFHADGTFWLWEYERNKPVADWNRLLQKIRDGSISVAKIPLVVVPGGSPAEALLRGMYYAGRLERRHALPFEMAFAMENQALPLGLASLWAGAGVKYSWKGICGCASRIPTAWDREHDIYWYTGLDGGRVLMKWNSMLNGNQSLGGYAECRDPDACVDYVTTGAASNGFAARYPYPIVGAFGRGWDDLKTLTDSFITVAKAKTDATRQVIVSNELDFFREFESAFGDSLPHETRSYGNEWDLLIASLQETSAAVRRATEKLRAAEAMALIVALENPSFLDGREAARDLAFMDLGMYYEHDWTGDGPVSRSARRDWQRRVASEIAAYVDTLHADSVTALGGMIQRGGSRLRFFAFNPLSWTRTDAAEIPYSDTQPFHVVDLATGEEVPSQIVTVDGQRRLQVLAREIPPVGYRVFEVVPGVGASFPPAATVAGSTIESAAYRIVLDGRGAVTSLVDKTRGNRQLATTIGGRAVNDLGSGSGSLAPENVGPVSATLLATASGPLLHRTRVRLVAESPRIEIRNDIDQNFGDVRTWGFSFNLVDPDTWHEELGAVIRARLTAAGGHYSPRNARYDWLTLGHFVDMGGSDGYGVTLSSADTHFFQLGTSTTGALDSVTPLISVLAGGQIDSPGLGMIDQGGDNHFLQRFALLPRSAWNARSAMRAALEHQNPLVTGTVGGGATYPATWFSFATVSDPDTLMWALKAADDGMAAGLAARLWRLEGSPAHTFVAFGTGAVASADRATHVETPTAPAVVAGGTLDASLSGRQMATFLVRLGSGGAGRDPVLFASRTGGSTRLAWSFTGLASYTLTRSVNPQFTSSQTVFSGPGVEAFDDAPVTPGTAAFFRVQ